MKFTYWPCKTELQDNCLRIFTRLCIYGKIKPEYLLEKKMEVETFTFNLSDPVDTIWNKIEDLAELAKLTLRPFTEQQLADFAFIVINKQRAFREDVRAWMRRPPHLQTYADLKLHFTTAHTELRATDAITDKLGYHSTSAMVAQIIEQLRVAWVHDPPYEASQEVDDTPPPLLPHESQDTANAVTAERAPDPLMMQMIAQMQQMQQQLDARNDDHGYQPYQR